MIREIIFSPTGGTERVAHILVSELGGESGQVDLTDRHMDFGGICLNREDLAVIAVPSYGGRVPAIAAERISRLQGNGAVAVIACVYGNRAYDDTLVELEDLARGAGFRVIAAVAAVAEHSIAHRYAAGRPDARDRDRLVSFASQIRRKIGDEDFSEPAVPGNHPFRKAGRAGIIPKPTGACVKCGLCAAKCPSGAIDPDDPSKVDSKACISCMRCISVCPHGARKASPLMIALADRMLRKPCSERKECELYI